MTEHKLIDNTLVREEGWIVARCVCGWVSRPHVTSFAASASFLRHKEQADKEVS